MPETDLNRALKRHVEGDVWGDAASRGRYATDASIYQIMPKAVVVPKSEDDVLATIEVAKEHGAAILPRGGGTSQCGQTVNDAVVLDNTRHLNKILEIDPKARTCKVQPGLVLDDLNRALKPHGLWFPVDPSTASRATLGGMTANNSSGGRSLKYGIMRDNTDAITAILADGSKAHFNCQSQGTADFQALSQHMNAIGRREADEIEARFPKVQRRVGGYNLDALTAENPNLAHLLVGSEGTLAYFTELDLKLAPLPADKVIGVCHFPTFYAAMDATRHLVTLDPQAVELIDDTMIALGRDVPLFKSTIESFVTGEPAALLLVEFAEGAASENQEKLRQLAEMMDDLGFSFSATGAKWGGVVPITDPRQQGAIAEYRKAGLNIMMSMKEAGKPISFVEDCAVALPDLAEYTAGLTRIFAKHGTKGTWYAHASVGCLHVRPVLNMKLDKDVGTMRAIAEECFDLVAQYKGSHSGEHGDGIARSEFHEKMFGSRLVRAFEEVKTAFDPDDLLNPGKIVHAPKMDDRSNFRYHEGYAALPFDTELDWSAWPGEGGGLQGAVEMCNNNGACRKLKGGVMCPSFRATRNERDSTRGRANTLRLAITGQIGPEAFTSEAMADTMNLCVSCKGCRRECPTGVDMARMKIEVMAARKKKFGLSVSDRIIGSFPRYAPIAARFHWLMNLRNKSSILKTLSEPLTGFSRDRDLPVWSPNPFRDAEADDATPDVLLFADAFNRYFEPENLRAAVRVLRAAGLRVSVARDPNDTRPLDCGRATLSVGMIEETRKALNRVITTTRPFLDQGVPLVGLEPSSILTFRDEAPALLADAKILADSSFMFEEYLEKIAARLPLKKMNNPLVVHGHCHQKAHDVMSPLLKVLHQIPDVDLKLIESGCCGMAGAFGYGKDTAEISLKMAEQDLFPAVRDAPAQAIIVADGTSCRHQISDGLGKTALHVARVLDLALSKEATP